MYLLMQQRSTTLDPGGDKAVFIDYDSDGLGRVAQVYYNAWYSTGGWFKERSECLKVVKRNTKRLLSLVRANQHQKKAYRSPIAGHKLACIRSSPTKWSGRLLSE